MQQRNLRPSAVTYKALLDVCCKCNDLANVEGTVAQMQAEGHALDSATCTELARGFLQAGQHHKVVALLHTMGQMHTPASATLLNTISAGYAGDQRALESALAQLQHMPPGQMLAGPADDVYKS